MDRPTAKRQKVNQHQYDGSNNPGLIYEQVNTQKDYERPETQDHDKFAFPPRQTLSDFMPVDEFAFPPRQSRDEMETIPLRVAVKQAQMRIEAERAEREYAKFKKTEKKRSAKGVILMMLLLVFLSGVGFAGWYYWWTTYATFEYTLQPIVILEGQNVTPSDFIYPDASMERVHAAYRNPGFRPVAGQHSIPLALTMGWRSVDATASLLVLTTLDGFSHEYTEPGEMPKAQDYITNADEALDIPFEVRYLEEPLSLDKYEVGEFTLYLTMNDIPFEVALSVIDTTPPTASANSMVIQVGEEVKPMDFVRDISDASEIGHVRFIEEPDILAHKDQIVQIEIADIHGNNTYISSGLTILLNQEPPIIEGVETIASMVGDPILYRQGVTAHDDFGRPLEIDVDSSKVDQYSEGIYTVVFKATDFTGLTTVEEALVHVVAVDLDYVNERVDEVLATILEDGMTQLEEVHAIFMWVRQNVAMASTRGGPASSYEGAYRALQDRRGNCYIFYSISEVMLTRAGVPNMLIERIPGTPTNHRWNLINPDGKGWHHYDSYPSRVGSWLQMAYFTDSQARTFTYDLANLEERPMNNYYTYVTELYPEVVQR